MDLFESRAHPCDAKKRPRPVSTTTQRSENCPLSATRENYGRFLAKMQFFAPFSVTWKHYELSFISILGVGFGGTLFAPRFFRPLLFRPAFSIRDTIKRNHRLNAKRKTKPKRNHRPQTQQQNPKRNHRHQRPAQKQNPQRKRHNAPSSKTKPKRNCRINAPKASGRAQQRNLGYLPHSRDRFPNGSHIVGDQLSEMRQIRRRRMAPLAPIVERTGRAFYSPAPPVGIRNNQSNVRCGPGGFWRHRPAIRPRNDKGSPPWVD